ncbi:hypothetical protein E5288_WYG020383 [Bos mutus]|uniref:Uncharacterized protein n=1 Tax=Bos mutus TaxID=72004 RepID=A0A6B0RYH2_9CETA|nr:hypothetical protein [Bos mutus]
MANSSATYSCHSSGERPPQEEPNRSAFCFWSGLIPDVGDRRCSNRILLLFLMECCSEIASKDGKVGMEALLAGYLPEGTPNPPTQVPIPLNKLPLHKSTILIPSRPLDPANAAFVLHTLTMADPSIHPALNPQISGKKVQDYQHLEQNTELDCSDKIILVPQGWDDIIIPVVIPELEQSGDPYLNE